MIPEILYTLFIWPIHFIFEFLFVLFIRIFDAPGFAVIFLSIVINTLLLPIYLVADRWQNEEREIQNRMKDKIKRIRSNFSGDEKQMIINAYYRQMGYSPLFILKASVGLLIQIPFFIAAYQFLSKTKLLTGISFLSINDLNAPDALLKLPVSILGITAINLLPFLMTIINLLSSYIYAKNLGKREHIQLIAMALVFLILLYKSPSGLVLYWTLNNLYSFIKNGAKAYLKKPGRVLQIAAILIAVIFLYLIWTGKASVERYRILFTGFAILLAVIPIALPLIIDQFAGKTGKSLPDKKSLKENDGLFFSAVILIFLLIGFLNPLQVLSASVEDFENPWTFLRLTMLQGFSLLVMIPLSIRILTHKKIRPILGNLWSFLAFNCLAFYFIFSTSYGVMDRSFKLDDTNKLLYAFPLWVNFIVPFFCCILILIINKLKKIKILTIFLRAICAAILLLSLVNYIGLIKNINELSKLTNSNIPENNEIKPYFNISRTEKNVFIIFLDRAQGSAFLDALEYEPSLKENLEGFVFYPNILSFGLSTVTGLPPMMGGYYYAPLSINDRKNELLVDKVNSAITTLPYIFGKNGYRVVITDPVIANMQSVPDISIFMDLPNVSAKLLSGKLSNYYRKEFNMGEEKNNSFDFDILFRYGIFRASPPALRYGIYYKGQWWKEEAYNSYGRAIGEFSSLYYLTKILSIDNDGKTFNILMNSITHEGGYYNDALLPQETAPVFKKNDFIKYVSKENIEYIHVLLSGMNQLIKLFNYMKMENVFDNTRIIIISDHGGNYLSAKVTSNMEPYNPLLLVKDFYSEGDLIISEKLMTNADLPYLAINNILDFNNHLPENYLIKNFPLYVVSAKSSQPLKHGPYLFNLSRKRELIGGDVLKKESWGEWEKF